KAVERELIETRDSPAEFGPFVESNAHRVAFALAKRVVDAVWAAADLDGWIQHLSEERRRLAAALGLSEVLEAFREAATPAGNLRDKTSPEIARLSPERVAENFRAVAERLVAVAWPDCQAIVAAVEIESS